MSDIEQRLVEAARNGDRFECAEPDNVVRADLIRELLLGRHGELDPRGVVLCGARIDGTLDLDLVAAVVGLRLVNCEIDAPIKARGARLPNLGFSGSRCAGLKADGLTVEGDLRLGHGTRIAGAAEDGLVRLLGAHVGGDLGLTDVEIINSAGTALNLNGIRVDGGLLLRQQTRITGHRDRSAVDLVSARIGQNLEFTDTEISSTTGAAVLADRVQVGGAVFLTGRTRLSGGGKASAISLEEARVNGVFHCWSDVLLEVEVPSSPALDLQGMTVGSSVELPRTLMCAPPARECATGHSVRLDGFTYASLTRRWDWQQWLHLVRRHTPAYHASAYQRLAAVERAAGHDGTVRRILMAQQTDLRRRSPKSLGGFTTRRFHWMWGVLAGYGYRARRTAAALLVVLAIAGALGWWAGQVPTRPGHLAAERVTGATAATGVPCSTVELIGLGLDRGLPLAMTGMRARCDLDTASRAGQAFTAAIWLVQLAVWGLATLALAGYTNLVRKPG